jgi:hypothetical protein
MDKYETSTRAHNTTRAREATRRPREADMAILRIGEVQLRREAEWYFPPNVETGFSATQARSQVTGSEMSETQGNENGRRRKNRGQLGVEERGVWPCRNR